jgi:acetyltransferase-like isoleucine patch superfamily enzyme
MKERLALYMRSFLSFVHIIFKKIFNIRAFFAPPIQDLSASTKISVSGGGKIILGKHIHTRRSVTLEAVGGCLEIGDGCFFNNGCMTVAKEHISIGNYTSIGPYTVIYDHDHNIHSNKEIHDSGYVTENVVIGNNVWIGAHCVILRGTRIGDGCVIGAGSVIKGEYEPYTTVVQKRSETVTGTRRGKEVHNIV